jgi:ribosomal protein S18 acetylase RimI-like enzyme
MYKKEFYVFDQNQPIKAIIRNYQEKDIQQLIQLQERCFPPPFPSDLWWNKEQLQNHIKLFPEGALCAEINGQLVGSMTGLIVNFNQKNQHHSWESITDNGYVRNHNSEGNTLYMVDISVDPTYRKLGLGKWLMLSMYNVVIEKGLERLLGGARMPGYYKKASEMTAGKIC